MGREIRRVPPNWQHPKNTNNARHREEYQPMHDSPFAPRMREWYTAWEAWERGEKPEGAENIANFWDWDSGPPDPEYYRPDWPEGSATWFQVYETVSEGTPVTPPFATKAELIDYLATHGDFWDQARVQDGRMSGPAAWGRENAAKFVESEWAPSLTVMAGVVREPRDGTP